MTGFDVGEGKLARVDAVEPFVMMIAGFTQADGRLVVLEQVCRIRFPGSPVHPDGSFRTVKNSSSAPFRDGSVHDFDPILVDHAQFLDPVFGRDDLDRTGVVGVHAPLSDVKVMSSHVCEISVAILHVRAPAGKVVMDVVRAESFVVSTNGRGTLPSVPIDSFRDFFGREVAWFRGTPHAYADLLDLPDGPAANELDGLAELATEFRALLAPGLKDDLVLVYRLNHCSSLLDGQGNWLFAVNVLLRPGGQNSGFSMPVVGRCYKDGVHLFVSQEFSVVARDGQSLPILARGVLAVVFFNQSLGMVGPDFCDLGKASNLSPGVADQAVGMTAPLFAGADDRDVDPTVGRVVTLGGPYVGGKNEGSRTEGGLLDEFSTMGHERFSGVWVGSFGQGDPQSDSKAPKRSRKVLCLKEEKRSEILGFEVEGVFPKIFQGVVFALFLGEQVNHEINRIQN